MLQDMAWASLCEQRELIEGQGKYVEIGGYRLAVFLDRGTAFVMDDCCPHAGASLSSGSVTDGYAVCPRHCWAFELANGQLKDSPNCKISTYPVRLLPMPAGGVMVQADLPMP